MFISSSSRALPSPATATRTVPRLPIAKHPLLRPTCRSYVRATAQPRSCRMDAIWSGLCFVHHHHHSIAAGATTTNSAAVDAGIFVASAQDPQLTPLGARFDAPEPGQDGGCDTAERTGVRVARVLVDLATHDQRCAQRWPHRRFCLSLSLPYRAALHRHKRAGERRHRFLHLLSRIIHSPSAFECSDPFYLSPTPCAS